jgi:hypothetical protein
LFLFSLDEQLKWCFCNSTKLRDYLCKFTIGEPWWSARYGRTGQLYGVSFEKIVINLSDLIIVIIFRPPSSSLPLFFEEFFNFCTSLLSYGKVILLGDYNINLLSTHNKASVQFTDIIEIFGFEQIVTSPTRFGNSLLDRIIVKKKLQPCH